MHNNVNDILHGKALVLAELSVAISDDKLNLWLRLNDVDTSYIFNFYNVCCLSVKQLCMPCVVREFQVSSNMNFSVEDKMKYEIHDYFENMLSFYCEEFSFKMIPNN